jgi:hypothetical protein
VLLRLNDVADLDPAVEMTVPHEGSVTVRTAAADVEAARTRVAEAVSPYDDLEINVESNS